mgnify:FL=1
MAFQISPGVNVSEVDLTTVVPGTGTSAGAIAGPLQWGPVDEIKTIANEIELVQKFGKPNNDTATTFFSAANFLSYTGNLNVVRVIGASSVNATAGSTSILIKNGNDYASNSSIGATGIYGEWVAKYPGVLGNSIKVSMADSASYALWAYKGQFQGAPGTSNYAKTVVGNPNANDELHIIVIDVDGKISGSAGTVLEKYAYVSKASNAKTDVGETNYYKDVINTKSQYIWWGQHTFSSVLTSLGTAWGSAVPGATGFKGATGAITNTLTNAVDDNVPSAANIIGATGSGYQLFVAENANVNLIISGDGGGDTNASTVVKSLVNNIAEVRKDCIVFFSPKKADVVNNSGSEAANLVTYAGTTVNANSSYAVMDGNWKYQYDKYNDVYRWIPLNGDVAGLCARTDQTNDPWFSPAGYNRGVIKNVTKLAWNPSKAERDTIYQVGVNPVISQPGVGTVLFGDKTTLAKPSAFDRINVRRLFITLEKAISTSAKFSLFELNDSFTRSQFIGLVEPYLRDVKGRRGITDFKIVCDETNNTPQVIDSNSFVGDIYIKPARSINYIQLNFVAVRTGVEFNEIVGKF